MRPERAVAPSAADSPSGPMSRSAPRSVPSPASALRRDRPARVGLDDLPGLGELSDPASYLTRHSRSFRFAAAWMPKSSRDAVARVYAWCRYTDNLVDGDGSADVAERRLDAWLAWSLEGYTGRDTGIDLVNHVMGDMSERGIPFVYAYDLVRAMRSDLHFSPFADLDALRVYTYRAAGVVGRWLAELHRVREPWMLDRATALGQAMQLTNILRDVGEDLARGRMYLPLSELACCGLSVDDIDAIGRGARRIDGRYRELMERLMGLADADYRLAAEAIPYLPPEFRRAAAMASAVYQGIHGAIRRNGYDNVRLRAYTTAPRKVALAATALVALARSRAGHGVGSRVGPRPSPAGGA